MFDIFPKIYFEILFVILILFFLTFLKMENMSSSSVVLIMGIFAASAYRIMPAINRLFKSFQFLKYTYPPLKLIYDHLNLDIDLNEDLKIIKKYGITKQFIVPTALRIMLEEKSLSNTELASLKYISYGSSPIPVDLMAAAMKKFGCKFIQKYGMTETGGSCTALAPEDHTIPTNPRMNSVGKALNGVKLKIIDQIQNVRSKNNKYWMDVLRLAFKLAPDKASALMKKINLNDQKVSRLVKKLSNKKT